MSWPIMTVIWKTSFEGVGDQCSWLLLLRWVVRLLRMIAWLLVCVGRLLRRMSGLLAGMVGWLLAGLMMCRVLWLAGLMVGWLAWLWMGWLLG